LENITALLGRIILDFLQRIQGPVEIKGKNKGEKIQLDETRGEFPVILILEEAQNYIKEKRNQEQESPSKVVFERIAREGRKYGLSLVVASQRLSDLSRIVLSQCNSFIVHRLQNPEDLRYFREIVPAIHSTLLEQLPSLASQTALILGECVRAPMHVKIRIASPKPQSKNPELWKHWISQAPFEPDFEKICSDWEKGVKEKE
jgi:DNA helicase HerA-like ATPase